MKRTMAIVLTLATSLASGAEAAQLAVGREAQKDVMVTIYNGNLGLVKDVRETRLPTGLHETEFTDVAAQIDPTTVHLKSLTDPAGLRILERNYEYDLHSNQKLMEKYVGRIVRLYNPDGTYLEAKLLSTAGPVFEINGQIHLGHNGRLVLPSLPENLVSKPTLVWLLRNALAGPQRVEASYLTGGITWKADYVMVLNPAGTKADVTGWVTIDNRSGATYGNAPLQLVAGDVNPAVDGRRGQRAMEIASKAASMAEAARDFKSEGFFEYHLNTLTAGPPSRTTRPNSSRSWRPATCRSSSSSSTTARRTTIGRRTACPCRNRRSASISTSKTLRPTGSGRRCPRATSAGTMPPPPATSSPS